MSSQSLLEACVPSTFAPALHGGEILAVSAAVVSNYSLSVSAQMRTNEPPIEVEDSTFCNVTVTYTHPGQGDEINVEVWLPVDNYNGRMHAYGGGGWAGGRWQQSGFQMAAAMADGYATLSTDTGTGHTNPIDGSWGLLSPGNVDLFALQNIGSVALNDASVIGKCIVKDFYGERPDYSYFTGCSHGGRQGLMLAQRYPDAYDGITASAPAINWTSLFSGMWWPNQVMNNLGAAPHMCEVDALSSAAIAACDELDGVVDGIVANVDECRATFDPYSVVGQTCAGNSTIKVSETAAALVNAVWNGTVTAEGRPVYPGLSPSADLTAGRPSSAGLAPLITTACAGNGTCVAALMPLADQWMRYFLAKDPDADLYALTQERFDLLVSQGKQQFGSIMDTLDTDLSRFRKSGGKMLTYHGTDDSLIPDKSTEMYYDTVREQDASVRDYFRYYKIPGMNHCYGGTGQPEQFFNQLRAWVENGTAPETTGYEITTPSGNTEQRISCPYPRKAEFGACDDQSKAECWSCA